MSWYLVDYLRSVSELSRYSLLFLFIVRILGPDAELGRNLQENLLATSHVVVYCEDDSVKALKGEFTSNGFKLFLRMG